MSLPFAKTIPAHKRVATFGKLVLWDNKRLKGVSLPVGLYGCRSIDGVIHASDLLRREWEEARAVLSAKTERRVAA